MTTEIDALQAACKENGNLIRERRKAAVLAARPRLPKRTNDDWTIPAKEGERCDWCLHPSIPAPHAQCERQRAGGIDALRSAPDIDGRHGTTKNEHRAGSGSSYGDQFRMPGSEMKRTMEGGRV